MTDRELLEMAAKAAGVVGWFPNDAVDSPMFFDDPNNRSCYGSWNPLVDDGDALRLAVTLNFEIRQGESAVTVAGNGVWMEQDHGSDKLAATRRAIVRAAAEIGKSLP